MAKYSYVVLGAGKQGTAVAYDLALFGEAEKIVLADANSEAAKASADRINKLVGRSIVTPTQIDIRNQSKLLYLLGGMSSCVSAVPYYFNLEIAKVAPSCKVNFCDMGGNTDIVLEELQLDDLANACGISIIPDCGLAPGMATTLAVGGMQELDKCEEVHIRCGGLPQKPKPPLDYMLLFNIAGLTNEYREKAVVLRDGKRLELESLTELEEIEFAPLGKLEAFLTSGGTSTSPWTFEGKLKTFDYKTIRYHGHCAKMRTFKDLGFWDTDELREVFHKVVSARINFPGDKDVTLLRVTTSGIKSGKKTTIVREIVDYYDDKTGFTAMERTTAFPASIVAIMMARGETPKGAIPLETAVSPKIFLAELEKRSIIARRYLC